MKEGSRNGASLCEGFQRTPGRAPLLGTLKDMLHKAQKLASASIGASLLGNWRGAPFLGPSYLEEILWSIQEICKMPCKWVSLSIGALLGYLDGVCLPGF
jgi:hypothetical protein